MSRFFTYAITMAACLGTVAALANSTLATRRSQNLNAPLAADGAFRDGLYLGRLDAGLGRPLHPAVGRWSNEKDRASFLAGYRRGYDDSLASAPSVKSDQPE
jgi:hypothetical protein